MSLLNYTLLRQWWPPEEAENVEKEEPERSLKIMDGFRGCVEASKHLSEVERIQKISEWHSLIDGLSKSQFRSEIPREQINEFVLLVYEIVTTSLDSSFSNFVVKWAVILLNFISTYRYRLSITLPWRPVYKSLSLQLERKHTSESYRGELQRGQEVKELLNILFAIRRFFPEGSGDEIWEEVKTKAYKPHQPDPFMAAGWMRAIFPTRELLTAKESDRSKWSNWANEWMDIWDTIFHVDAWENAWMVLFACMAKHDRQGLIDWESLLPKLYAKILWSFQVPVGTASSTPPYGKRELGRSEALYPDANTNQLQRMQCASKLCIWLLGKCPSASSGEDPALLALERLGQLLEQYYHPSNNGKWTRPLSSFLKQLCRYLSKRAILQHTRLMGKSPDSPSDSEDDDIIDEPMRDSQNGSVNDHQSNLSEEAQRRVVRVILKLASKAQFSKDEKLAGVACASLARCAIWLPDEALPLITSRFQMALENVTASRQLVSAIDALTYATRTLLLVGLKQPEDGAQMDSDTDPRVVAAEAISMAMNATLPGIDANDEQKTNAVFRLYCTILTTVGNLEEDGALPLFTEEWLEDFLSRLFSIFMNVDNSETRAELASDDLEGPNNSTFLLSFECMFKPLVCLVFARLPKDLRLHALNKVAGFVNSTLLNNTGELAILCGEVSRLAPEESLKHIIEPLLANLEEDLAGIKVEYNTAERPQLSKVRNASLCSRLHILEVSVSTLGSHSLALKDRLRVVLKKAFNIASQKVCDMACGLLDALLHTNIHYFLLEQYSAAPFIQNTSGNGPSLEAWLSVREPKGFEKDVKRLGPKWHIPNREGVVLAEELLEDHLLAPCRRLVEICKSSEVDPAKEELVNILARIQSCLQTAHANLPDLEHPELDESLHASLGPHAKDGLSVGSSEWRAQAGHALLLASRHNFSDPEVQQNVMWALESIIPHGTEKDQVTRKNAWRKDVQVLHDSPEFNMLLSEEGKWKKLCPRCLVIQACSISLSERVDQSLKFKHQTAKNPILPSHQCPSLIKDLTVEVLRYCLQPFQKPRSSARHTMSQILKTYPCLVPSILPTLLCAIANLPLPSSEDLRARMDRDYGPGKEDFISSDMIQQLVTKSQAGNRALKEELTAAEMTAEEARVTSALGLLWPCQIGHHLLIQPSLLSGLALSFISGLSNRNPESVRVTWASLLMLTVAFQGPPYLSDPKYVDSPEYKLLFQTILALGRTDSDQHWKIKLAANAFIQLLMPPTSPDQTQILTKHYLKLISNQLDPLRQLADLFLGTILDPQNPQVKAETQAEARNSLKSILKDDPTWGATYIELQSHAHPARPSNQMDSTQALRKARTPEVYLVDAMVGSFFYRLWPDGRPRPNAMSEASFHKKNVILLQVMTQGAPSEMIETLKGQVTQLLEGVVMQDKRPLILTAIEGLTALIASGIVFQTQGGGKSAWDEWVKSLLENALQAAPLDYGEVWACALRYCIYELAESSEQGFKELLSLVLKPIPTDGDSQAIIKKLKIYGHISAELTALDVVGQISFDAKKSPIKAAGQNFQRQVLSDLLHLSESSGESIRRHVASTAVVILAAILNPIRDQELDSEREFASEASTELADSAQGFLDFLIQSMKEGVELVREHEKQPNSENMSEAENGSNGSYHFDLLNEPKIARLGTALQVFAQSLRGGERICAVQMRPTLLKMLPYLLRIQEMASPGLQPLAMEAKTMLVIMKYLPIPPEDFDSVVTTLFEASKEEQWWCRAAALVFMQYFWFRHSFLMTSAQAELCQTMVTDLIRDRKIEINEIAADTLAGMLKGLSAKSFSDLKASLIKELNEKAALKYKNGPIGSEENTKLGSLHAVVLSLKSFVLSTPYDVPSWLPEVLMALVKVSTRPNPVRATVRKTLSEFKRTHEEAGLTDIKRMMTEDQWESIQGIASPASYFA